MTTPGRPRFSWVDIVWLLFLAGLAVLPPRNEIHKQLILLAIGILQLLEGTIVRRLPRRGPYWIVALKVLLATLLLDHTGDVAINSSYYPIYYLPVVTAAIYFGPVGTILWTLLASALYWSYLVFGLPDYDYELAPGSLAELVIRTLFFFLAAILVNQFAEKLAETNRRLERAQVEMRRSERLAALGQLSAGLAHEIRNPLGVIKGSAEMLQKKLPESNPLAAEMAGYISGEVNRLSVLVSRFLDFARPLQLDLKVADAGALVDRALKSVADTWTGPTIHVERQYAPNLPPIRLDEGFFEQVFFNLVQNAYQAMEEGGGTLRVSVGPGERNGTRGVEVAIEDTGAGVSPGLQEQIFNPFFTTKKSGVGLGLSIVSKIVDEHHGAIRLTSGPGKGACFRVFLPAAPEG